MVNTKTAFSGDVFTFEEDLRPPHITWWEHRAIWLDDHVFHCHWYRLCMWIERNN